MGPTNTIKATTHCKNLRVYLTLFITTQPTNFTNSMTATLFRKTVTATAAQLIGRAINICIPFIAITYYGANNESDFFFFGLTVSFFFYGTICNALNDALASKLITDNKIISSKQTALYAIFAALITFTLLTLTYRQPISNPIFASIIFSLIAVVGLATIQWIPRLISRGDFHSPGLVWAWRLVPIALFLSLDGPSNYGIIAFVLCIFVGDLARTTHLSIITNKHSTAKTKELSNHELWGFWPYLAGTLLHGLSPIIDRLIASWGETGDLTTLEAADRIFWTLATATTIGLQSVLLVELGARLNNGRLTRQYLHRLQIFVVGLSLIAAGGLYLTSIAVNNYGDQWILSEMSPQQRTSVSECLLIYTAILPVFVLSTVYARVLITAQKHRLILNSGIISISVNTLASLLCFMLFGLPGIVAGTLISAVVTGAYCYNAALKQLPE